MRADARTPRRRSRRPSATVHVALVSVLLLLTARAVCGAENVRQDIAEFTTYSPGLGWKTRLEHLSTVKLAAKAPPVVHIVPPVLPAKRRRSAQLEAQKAPLIAAGTGQRLRLFTPEGALTDEYVTSAGDVTCMDSLATARGHTGTPLLVGLTSGAVLAMYVERDTEVPSDSAWAAVPGARPGSVFAGATLLDLPTRHADGPAGSPAAVAVAALQPSGPKTHAWAAVAAFADDTIGLWRLGGKGGDAVYELGASGLPTADGRRYAATGWGQVVGATPLGKFWAGFGRAGALLTIDGRSGRSHRIVCGRPEAEGEEAHWDALDSAAFDGGKQQRAFALKLGGQMLVLTVPQHKGRPTRCNVAAAVTAHGGDAKVQAHMAALHGYLFMTLRGGSRVGYVPGCARGTDCALLLALNTTQTRATKIPFGVLAASIDSALDVSAGKVSERGANRHAVPALTASAHDGLLAVSWPDGRIDVLANRMFVKRSDGNKKAGIASSAASSGAHPLLLAVVGIGIVLYMQFRRPSDPMAGAHTNNPMFGPMAALGGRGRGFGPGRGAGRGQLDAEAVLRAARGMDRGLGGGGGALGGIGAGMEGFRETPPARRGRGSRGPSASGARHTGRAVPLSHAAAPVPSSDSSRKFADGPPSLPELGERGRDACAGGADAQTTVRERGELPLVTQGVQEMEHLPEQYDDELLGQPWAVGEDWLSNLEAFGEEDGAGEEPTEPMSRDERKNQ
ncbi:unnamed protein product [Pedinophyceae sp. YPF-701]|nr:unnamed protein product [Pedinophyceae sp. YPF-701]